MRKEANLEQWNELYQVTMNIKKLEPWNYLWDMDIITIFLPEYEEPFYCSVMGRGGECFAVAVYKGYDAIHGFYKLADAHEILPDQLIRYQDNLTCYFGDREELNSKEIKTIKDLGLKFRGRNQWIFFRSFKPGYVPYFLNEEEVIELTNVFKNLFMSLRALIEQNLKVNFEEGHTLYRMFDKKKSLWLNFEGPLQIPERKVSIPVIKNDVLIEKIKRKKHLNNAVEFDTIYLNAVIDDKKYERPIFPRLIIFADKNTGMLLHQNMMLPEENDVEQILNNFIDVLLNIGIPNAIYVRDEYLSEMISDLCKKVKIEIIVSERLPSIDEFAEAFSNEQF